MEVLRCGREFFAANFPLTEDLWLEWIEDEKKLIEGNEGSEDAEEEMKTMVEPLFERGVKDYLAPKLWLEYIQYAIRWLGYSHNI